MAAVLRQILSLIRDHSHIDIGAGQIFFIQVVEPVRRMIDGFHIQGIFLLHSIVPNQVDVIVVALLQAIEMEQGFEGPERIPQGELVQGIVVKFFHKAAVPEDFGRNLRELGQGTALRFGQLLCRHKPGKHRQNRPQKGGNQQAQGA